MYHYPTDFDLGNPPIPAQPVDPAHPAGPFASCVGGQPGGPIQETARIIQKMQADLARIEADYERRQAELARAGCPSLSELAAQTADEWNHNPLEFCHLLEINKSQMNSK